MTSDHLRQILEGTGASFGLSTPAGYTCDGCGAAPRCPFVFDAYNTDGACLGEK